MTRFPLTYPQAIVVAATLIAGTILADRVFPVAAAQNAPESVGLRAENAVAGERLWWVETRAQSNRVHMCVDVGNGVRCRHEDVAK